MKGRSHGFTYIGDGKKDAFGVERLHGATYLKLPEVGRPWPSPFAKQKASMKSEETAHTMSYHALEDDRFRAGIIPRDTRYQTRPHQCFIRPTWPPQP